MAFQSFLLMMLNKTNILCVSKEKLRTFISDGSSADDNEAASKQFVAEPENVH